MNRYIPLSELREAMNKPAGPPVAPPKKPRKESAPHLSPRVIVALMTKLGEVGVATVEPDGFRKYTYNEGWEDERVAREFGLTRVQVSRLRQGEFGTQTRRGEWKLPEPPKPKLAAKVSTTDDEETAGLRRELAVCRETISKQGARIARIEAWLERELSVKFE
jgi:hypothetical protein